MIGGDDDQVKLRITPRSDPYRPAELVMGRPRAEAIVHMGPGTFWPSHTFEIHEERPVLLKWALILGVLRSSLSFVAARKELAAFLAVALLELIAAVAAIYLPASHYRVLPVVAFGAVAFLAGFLGARKIDET